MDPKSPQPEAKMAGKVSATPEQIRRAIEIEEAKSPSAERDHNLATLRRMLSEQ